METSEELEWELYDIFISGIFAFPVYEHNAARRIVRYLLMRGVLDEEIANAIEGPTVDLRIWLNRGGKHLVGEWVIAWLNDCRDQYRNRRRPAARSTLRRKSRPQDRKKLLRKQDDGPEVDDFSVENYLRSSEPHRSSFSSDSGESQWTKEESDFSSDYDSVSDREVEETELDVEVVERTEPLATDEEDDPKSTRPRKPQPTQIRVEGRLRALPRYKLNRPRTLTLDPDVLRLPCTGDAPDSGHVSDTPCSCLLPCTDSPPPIGGCGNHVRRNSDGLELNENAYYESCLSTLSNHLDTASDTRSNCYQCCMSFP